MKLKMNVKIENDSISKKNLKHLKSIISKCTKEKINLKINFLNENN